MQYANMRFSYRELEFDTTIMYALYCSCIVSYTIKRSLCVDILYVCICHFFCRNLRKWASILGKLIEKIIFVTGFDIFHPARPHANKICKLHALQASI